MNPQSAYSHRTERLYEQNESNVFEFTATVIDCIRTDDGLFAVELDRTAFFPEGGGQYSDTGIIVTGNGTEVNVLRVDVSDGRILHTVSNEISQGSIITAALDKDKRLRRMQNHSGEHIISGLLHSLYGIENAGFHMTEGRVNEITIDTAAPLTDEMLRRVEALANKAVLENRRIICYYPSPELLETVEYRSKTELSGEIRLVEIEGIDVCACCAPHVTRTGEIGPIVIKSFMKYKRGVRITAVCGEDALEYLRMAADSVSAIARMYSTQPEEAYSSVLRREELIKDKLAEIYSLRRELLEYKLKDIAASVTDRSKSICVFEAGCDASLMRNMVNEGVKLTDACFAVFSEEGETIRYTVGSRDRDLSSLSSRMRDELDCKGGGKGTMISGICHAGKERIIDFFESLSL